MAEEMNAQNAEKYLRGLFAKAGKLDGKYLILEREISTYFNV